MCRGEVARVAEVAAQRHDPIARCVELRLEGRAAVPDVGLALLIGHVADEQVVDPAHPVVARHPCPPPISYSRTFLSNRSNVLQEAKEQAVPDVRDPAADGVGAAWTAGSEKGASMREEPPPAGT